MVTLSQDSTNYLVTLLSDLRSLLDNVHCYETEEFKKIPVAQALLRGETYEEALNYSEDE